MSVTQAEVQPKMPSRQSRPILREWQVRKARWVAAGVLQEDVADALGVTPGTLSRWMHGRNQSPADIDEQLARAIPQAARARKRALQEQLRALGQGGAS